MSQSESVSLRPVEPADIATFFAQQLDQEAVRMAAFVSDRSHQATFAAHWDQILRDPRNTNRTVVAAGQVAGHISCYPLGENLEVTYWLGRAFWGRGIATEALRQFLQLVTTRPLTARTAKDNFGSLRVLQKCGFEIVGEGAGFAHGRGQETEEYLLRLDPTPPRP